MKRTVVILGPTAGGKSELAVALAKNFSGEVIGADSMQVYRGLDAGTAKPSAKQLKAAKHHLIDVVEPTEPWTVADWLDRVEALIADMHQRGKLPVIVGGTNLYLKSLLEGMFEGPAAADEFRGSLTGVETQLLHDRLRTVDPAAAQRIHRNDRKRITRALEVQHVTGIPISQQQEQWFDAPGSAEDTRRDPTYKHAPIMIGLDWPTPVINGRINARVKTMFPGLIDETRDLQAAGKLGPQAAKALGTKQVLAHLAGENDLETCIEQVKIETRRFAKAQRTWLKRYRGVHWLPAHQLSPAELAERSIAIIEKELAA